MTHSPDDRAVMAAVGEELRLLREARGLTRPMLASMLPSGITDRTLQSYEHGIRLVSVPRLLEICRVMGADGPLLLEAALQRARVDLETTALRVNLRALLNDPTPMAFRGIHQWVRAALKAHPVGVVLVEPAGVKHLALFMDCTHLELATYLCRFTPEPGE